MLVVSLDFDRLHSIVIVLYKFEEFLISVYLLIWIHFRKTFEHKLHYLVQHRYDLVQIEFVEVHLIFVDCFHLICLIFEMYSVQYHYFHDLINDRAMSLDYFSQVKYDYTKNPVVNYQHIILMYVNLVKSMLMNHLMRWPMVPWVEVNRAKEHSIVLVQLNIIQWTILVDVVDVDMIDIRSNVEEENVEV